MAFMGWGSEVALLMLAGVVGVGAGRRSHRDGRWWRERKGKEGMGEAAFNALEEVTIRAGSCMHVKKL